MEEDLNDLETESSEEDEVMPTFKYIRIANHLKNILKTDTVTCAAAHPRFLIFGTFFGRVYLLDHQGNLVDTFLKDQSQYSHSVAVNSISIDNRGEYIATCSDDGKVFITGLYSDDDNQRLVLEKIVKSVALNPDMKTGLGKKFIVGDNNLTLYESTFLSRSKTTILSKNDSYVSAISWNNQYVAWTCGSDVRIYDLNEKCSLGVMKWEQPKKLKLEKFRCNLKWSNSTTLLIGWVDTIRICIIRKRNAMEVSTMFLSGYLVDPIATFQTNFYVCGLAPFETNQLVVLGYSKELDKENNGKALRPILCILKYEASNYEEICADTLSIRGYEYHWVNDYYLDCIIDENQYFIISPKDVVVASLYDIDDRIQWFVDQRKFDEALKILSSQLGEKEKKKSVLINRLYIDHLLSCEKYEEAAKLCYNVLGNDKSLWEEEIYKFVKLKQLRSISNYLPRTKECKLGVHVYEMVLFEYLKMDAKGFLNLIKEWEPYLYDSKAVINAIKDNFNTNYANELLESLAILYAHCKEYDNSLAIYLKLKNKGIFELIKTQNLYSVIHHIIIELIELDANIAIDMLLEKDKIPPEVVVQQLEQKQDFLCKYLDRFDKVDKSGKYSWKLVSLYAKHEPKKLLPFLKRSNNYPIQEAFDICKREKFYEEMVFLLNIMGNTKEALNIIIHKIKNITTALEFCKEHYNDLDLWNCLIDESLKTPKHIIEVLNGIAGYVNPELLVNKIKLDQEIPGLKPSLIKMLREYSLEISKKDVCNKIFLTDYFNLHDKLIQSNKKALKISNDSNCAECTKDFFSKDSQNVNIIMFNCHHYFHGTCLKVNFCPVCQPKKP